MTVLDIFAQTACPGKIWFSQNSGKVAKVPNLVGLLKQMELYEYKEEEKCFKSFIFGGASTFLTSKLKMTSRDVTASDYRKTLLHFYIILLLSKFEINPVFKRKLWLFAFIARF